MFYKLAEVGVNMYLLRWFQSHLSNGYQTVRISEHSSDFLLVTLGVSQGSHLGPVFP